MKKSDFKNEDGHGIVCFSGCDWWYHNRGLFCPQIMTRLAKHHTVLFVNNLAMRFPSMKEDKYASKKIIRKLLSLVRFLRRIDNKMYVFTPISLPFFEVPVVGAIMTYCLLLQVRLVMAFLSLRKPIVYVGCPPAWEIVKKLRRRYLIYQRTDIYEEMPGVNKSCIASWDDALTKAADKVLYVNSQLWRQGSERNRSSLLIGHGVDFERFADAEQQEYVPEDIAAIPGPIVGFFGDIIEDVCDFSLLEKLAKTLPKMSFVLVGPISSNVSNLRKYNNIYFLGPKPYEQIPHYGKMFDVAIMPWKKNRWIELCNPVKTKEYLALGKPIVSIDYPELKPYKDIVYSVSNHDQFIDAVRKALDESDPQLKQKRRERVRHETWDNKVRQITEFIGRGLQHESDA